ncbi:hypothetical protein SBOR_7114 [Sclerotinia borealis F-4128]|uniref:Uncharacterized protein n=1 Tax=Sclerotinia borealis (strain F-4128) TaxID=1432307 RepID=W9C9N8_SCLBF|nr:hypothetical protein SBOR_7114 [Sclerotinia borealis F-4128]
MTSGGAVWDAMLAHHNPFSRTVLSFASIWKWAWQLVLIPSPAIQELCSSTVVPVRHKEPTSKRDSRQLTLRHKTAEETRYSNTIPKKPKKTNRKSDAQTLKNSSRTCRAIALRQDLHHFVRKTPYPSVKNNQRAKLDPVARWYIQLRNSIAMPQASSMNPLKELQPKWNHFCEV